MQFDRLPPFDADDFALPARLLPLAAVEVAAAAGVQILDVQVLHVELEIGDTPGNPRIVPHDNAGSARQGDSGHVQSGRPQVRHEPDSGQRILHVHVVREQRLPRGGVAPGKGPRVGAGLGLGAGANRPQVLDLSGIAIGQHVALGDFFPPRGGEVAEHVEADQQAVHRAPGARLVAEQREFERKAAKVGRNVEIHAARIGGERSAVGRRQRDVSLLGDSPEPEPPRLAVAFEQRRAEDLRQVAGGESAQPVHLKQPVLGGDVSLRE